MWAAFLHTAPIALVYCTGPKNSSRNGHKTYKKYQTQQLERQQHCIFLSSTATDQHLKTNFVIRDESLKVDSGHSSSSQIGSPIQ